MKKARLPELFQDLSLERAKGFEPSTPTLARLGEEIIYLKYMKLFAPMNFVQDLYIRYRPNHP